MRDTGADNLGRIDRDTITTVMTVNTREVVRGSIRIRTPMGKKA